MSNSANSPLARAQAFAERIGIRIPILLAPMSGACPPSLSVAVASAGGLGGCGALLMSPAQIQAWCDEFRQHSSGAFQLNLWIPDPEPLRDPWLEAEQRNWLAQWGPPVPPEAGDGVLPDFNAQCQSVLAAAPRVVSSIMGIYAPDFVSELKSRGILWFANATTADEARAAADAGADAIVAQGSEAGGHRGTFDADDAERHATGLFALLPQVTDAVSVPVIAAGGVTDARAVAAALVLGASAVQIGTGFLRSPESSIHPVYAARLAETQPHHTALTRAFSGRAGRAIVNPYVSACATADAPSPAPYPIQRGLTRGMREAAAQSGNAESMQMWAGQSAHLAQARPAAEIARELWQQAQGLLA